MLKRVLLYNADMNTLVHADIFFFISTIALVIISLFVAVALFFVVKILRDVQVVVSKIRKAGNELEEDFEHLRSAVKAQGYKARAMVDVLIGFFSKKTRSNTPRTKKKVPEVDVVE